jgi:hypothetical protein
MIDADLETPMTDADPYDEFQFPADDKPSPEGGIRHGARRLTRDVVALAELQLNLLQVEAKDWTQTIAVPSVILGVVAAVAALASIPILLLSFAYWLVAATELSLPLALLAAGGLGLVIAVVCGLIAMARIRKTRSAFSRFRFELGRNTRWLKQVLSRPSEVANPFPPNATPPRPR